MELYGKAWYKKSRNIRWSLPIYIDDPSIESINNITAITHSLLTMPFIIARMLSVAKGYNIVSNNEI